MSIIKIALADNHIMFCESMETYLNQKKNFKVIITAYSGRDLLQQLEKADVLPDIILLDLNMENIGGREALPIIKVKYPEIKVVILSFYADLKNVKEMINLGASGYLCKGGSVKDVIDTVNNVSKFGYFLDPKVEKELRNTNSKKNLENIIANNTDDLLNDTEKKVLKLICKQKLNKEIASILNLSIKSIEYHRSNLLRKTNSTNVVGLVCYAFDNMLDIK